MKAQEQIRLDVLKRSRLFGGLLPAELKDLIVYSTSVRYDKGASIFKEGDRADFFYAVQEGLVKLYKGTFSGKHFTFTVAGPSDTLNATAVSGDNYFMSAQALNEVVLLRIGRTPYLAFLSKHHTVALELIAMLARRLNRECDRVVGLLGEDVEHRLLISLFTLARKFGTSLSLTREELASCAGTTTETAIRVLSRLKKQGIISGTAERGGIIITDLTKLQKLVAENEGWI
ncbi:MAG TPA: Crp/Fnr family transcriptional regulator [Syntrophorhabdaceae bacterium]|nr:Crp/Fnr family transcriptional regulator [Syntrophorhabdaceae bacterium]